MPATVKGSAIIYRGPSRIDGKPIVIVATGLSGKGSSNVKTGAMVQTWILRADMSPMDALRQGADVSICGGCPHRPKTHNGKTFGGRSCYVNVAQAPMAVWRTLLRGGYESVTLAQLAEMTRGKMVRLGSYGDPAAAPMEVWEAYTRHAAGRTGYTHQWKAPRLRDVTSLCQASVDTIEEADRARALGLGYFRVSPAGGAVIAGEIRCPASAEAGKLKTCAECRMCDGSKGLPVVIDAHGIGSAFVSRRAALPVLS